jgi:surface protein
MFGYAESFNQDLSSWDVSSGTDFRYMFYEASEFDQDITTWEVDANASLNNMFEGADLMQSNQQFSSTPKSSDFNKSSATYSITLSASSIAEGGTLKTRIKTTEVPNRTRLYWSLSGDDIDSDDVVGGNLTGSGVVKKGKLNLKHKFDKDLVTEGDETLELKIFTDADLTEQVGETKEITIEDVIPTYAIKTKSSIAEGGTLKTSIKTTDVPNNTRLYWSLSGDDIDSDDVIGGNLTGSGKVKKGKLNLKHKFDKDLITEGDETLELKLFTDAALTEQVGDTKEITIEDVIPSYAIKTKPSIGEGGILKTKIKTTELANNTRLYWSLSGDNIDSEDLSKGSLTGSGLVKKNKFSIKHTLAKDLLTEGNETLEIKLFTDAALTEQVGETKEVVILDNSISRLSSARLFSESGEDKLYGQAGNDPLFTRERDDLLYGGEGNDIFETTKGGGTDIISPYDNETDSTELIAELKESVLNFGYIAGETKIKDENDLMGIVQNTIADDITFI